jgi:hypothetical protein
LIKYYVLKEQGPEPAARITISVSIRRKRSVSYDPFYGGWPILYAHWQSACADESREHACGGVYVVGMYVSLLIICLLNYLKSIMLRVTIPVAGEREGKIREKTQSGNRKCQVSLKIG